MSYLGRSAKLSLKAQEKVSFLATAGQTSKTGLSYTPSFVEVYVNGVLLTDTTDYTATNGNSITFTVALLVNDEVTVVSLKTFASADHYTKSAADTLLAAKSPLASPSFTGSVGIGTSSPSAKLELNVPSGDGLLINSADVGTIKMTLAGGSQKNWGFATTKVAAGDFGLYQSNSNGGDPITAGTAKMYFTSSGDVLVGGTNTAAGVGNAAQGISLSSSKFIAASRSSGTALHVNRSDTDGSIVEFHQHGTTVGSIGTDSGYLHIANGGSTGLRFTGTDIRPCTATGADQDGNRDLGDANARFKDLYLSGGVYLGGTGAANKLDDYEEGTWTPAISGASVSGGSYVGHYTKIGRQVFFQWYSTAMTISSASGAAAITGLPFGSSNATQAYGVFYYQHGNAVDAGSRGGYVGINETKMTFVDTNGISGATYVNGTNKYIMISGSYFVA